MKQTFRKVAGVGACLLSIVIASCDQSRAPARTASGSIEAQAENTTQIGIQLAQSAADALVGHPAPSVTLTTLNGKTIDLTKLYGKEPIYLKFWATWCGTCRLQMDHFEKVQRIHGRDIHVIAVNAGFNETPDGVRRYRDQVGLTMPVAIDDGRLADAFHLRVTPQHVVIGRDGRILHVGHLTDSRLDEALAQAIAEPPVASLPSNVHKARTVRAAPPLLTALTGQPIGLSDKTRPTIIFFMSPWCESYLKTSRPEMAKACGSAREQVSRLARSQDIRWIAVAAGLWATSSDVAAYQRDHILPMPIAIDDTGSFFRAFGVTDVPTFIVLDRIGHEIARTQDAQRALTSARHA